MEDLLLHHCCAICSPKVIEILSENYKLASFWFNPNIHPENEYDLRKKALLTLTADVGLKTYFGPEYIKEKWLENVSRQNTDRCLLCVDIRLKETAKFAKKLGIKNFSTTLLSSSYQKHEQIKQIGKDIANCERVEFVYHDFRPFFYEGKNYAKNMNLYSQKYCGCTFSLEERSVKQEKIR